jgi:hypothetical protein
MKKTTLQEARDYREALESDTDFWLGGALLQWADTDNPYFAWMAIEYCIERQIQFPQCLIAYLAQCAGRMLSDQGKKGGRDLRKVLPRIFAFPNSRDPKKRKRGPGNLLDPFGGDPHRSMFALKFAIKLEQGEMVSDAVRNACNEALFGKSADVDDKTLRSWLQKEFGLQRQPSDAAGWKKAARDHFLPICDFHAVWKKSRETLS